MKGKPSAVAKLEAHQLTVIQLRFSPDSKKLLSVGRDRIAIIWELIDGKWTQEKVFGKGEKKILIHLLKLLLEMKGHTRLLWNGCWAHSENSTFFTVGRDKQLIVWRKDEENWTKTASYSASEAITAIDSIVRVTK